MIARAMLQQDQYTDLWDDEFIDYTEDLSETVIADNPLIAMHLPLINGMVTAVTQCAPVMIDHGDLVNAGICGLVDAIGDFQFSGGMNFEEFCIPKIEQALLDAVRYAIWIVKNS